MTGAAHSKTTADKRHKHVIPWLIVSIIVACVILAGGLYVHRLVQQKKQDTLIPVEQAAAPAALVNKATANAQPIDTAALQQDLQTFESNLNVGKDYSIIVEQPDGHVLLSVNPNTPRTPASNLKTFTALAAVHTLDMNSTLNTTTYLVNSTPSHAVVVLKGSGDMLLGSGYNDPNHIFGRAGLATLAEQTVASLKEKRITAITLDADNSLFGSEDMPPTMIADASSQGYFTPIVSMAIDEGKIGSLGSNPDSIKNAYLPRETNPVKSVVDTFASLLQKDGIAVNGQYNFANTKQMAEETSKTQLAQVHSAPLWEILRLTLQQSNNSLMELFGRLIANKVHAANSTAGATSAVTSIDEKLGINMTGVHMADCCGLSNGSTATVAALVQVQRQFYDSANAAALEGMGVSGFSGTPLEHNFTPETYGLVRAKTGTLSNVSSMSGNVLRTKGGLLFFSVIINNPTNLTAAQDAIDAFVGGLTQV